MSLEDNKTVVRRFLEEAIAQGNLEVFDTSFAQGVAVHFSNTPPHDHASYRKLVQQVHQAMADHSVTFLDLIAEEDTVAARVSYTAAKHHGHLGKNPPTGQSLQLESTFFFHFEQGKVTEMWVYYEGASFDFSPSL